MKRWLAVMGLLQAAFLVTAARADDRSSLTEVVDGPCVLLHNGNVLFGQATKVGQVIYLTRKDGSAIQLSEDQVACTGASILELHEYRRNNRLTGDASQIQADARWCLRYGLIRQAAEDVLLAKSLAPSDPETQQLIRQVARRLKSITESDTSDQQDRWNQWQKTSVRQVSHEESSMPSVPEEPEPSIDEDSFNQFVTRIQPMLTNRCAGCHARSAKGVGDFPLHAAITSSWAPKRVAEDNLRSVMKFVDLDRPMESLLRTRAMDQHGGRRKSFGDSASPMMENLDGWLSTLRRPDETTNDPDFPSADSALAPSPPPELHRVSEELDGESPDTIPAPQLRGAIKSDASEPSEATAAKNVRRMPKVNNPFDPDIFNRRIRGH
ncbi:hypothetical protein FYK55_18060 [Roseiconus nitratireducens]|uniref:Cytochrome c domain-containing protein n=1 Tax=Roseiconus nitratireducens TaxID=2605748 RepID=A0A5M6D1S6_9BACT|nr:hypothetical protein [Roseiconus nitratireducens]KAA5541467.1 hypothetical protein FYK55_18060 [Roseiconus nitratireducens]